MVATPHHLPALPTAAPVTVDIDPGSLVSGVADQRLVQRIRRVTATGERLLQIVVPSGFGGRRVALTAALDIGGHVLVVTGNPRRRNAWRRAFQSVRDRADTADTHPTTVSGRPAAQPTPGRRPNVSTLTCITAAQLRDLLFADAPTSAASEPPLAGLGVLVLDLRRARARDWRAIEHLLESNAAAAPVVLALGGATRGPLIARRATSGALADSGTSPPGHDPIDVAPNDDVRHRPSARRQDVPRLHGRPVSALRTQRVFVEPALLVRSRRLHEYQELHWLVPLSGAATAASRSRFRAARAIVDHLRPDVPDAPHVPGLARFVESQLPHTERPRGSTRSAYIRALSKSRRWVASLIRVHRSLGGQLPASTATMLRSVDDLRRPVRATDFCLVLARYRTVVAEIDHDRARARVRLVDEATARFGFETVGSRIVADRTLDQLPLHRPALHQLVDWELRHSVDGAVVVLADGGGPDDAFALARALEASTDRCPAERATEPTDETAETSARAIGALHDDALFVTHASTLEVQTVAHPLAAEIGLGVDVDDAGHAGWTRVTIGDRTAGPPDAVAARRDLAVVREAASSALDGGALRVLVCTTDAIGALARARPELRHRIRAIIDARAQADSVPLPILAAPLLQRRRGEPRSPRVVNLWRVLVVGPGEIARRNIARRIRTCELTASLWGDRRAQYGDSSLRDLLDLSITDEARAGVPEHDRRAFNRRHLQLARRSRLIRDRWRSLSGLQDHLAVEVEIDMQLDGRRPPPGPAGIALAGTGTGAQMSERRARARFERFVSGRRGLWLQALIAIAIATLLLPTVAGPILGSLVAAGCVGMVAMRTERRIASLRRRTLHRPASRATVVRDVACVVLRTIRSCEGIPQHELPTRLIRCVSAGERRMQVWLDSDDERLVRQFTRTLVEALAPIGDQRYIVGRPQTRVPTTRRELRDAFQLHLTTYHPVPTIFGARRERAELYAGHWTQVFGPGRLRYTAGGKGRLLRFAHFGQDHLRVRARTVTALR